VLNPHDPTPLGTSTSDADTSALLTSNGVEVEASIDGINDFAQSSNDFSDMNVPLEELDWDSLLSLPETFDGFPALFDLPASSDISATILPLPRAGTHFTEGFQLQQLDSVEAKCIDLREYLRSS
jgi:hypothetical protein